MAFKFVEEDLYKSLKENFGYNNFREKQLDIIKSILNGEDSFVIMPTGAGKSICFQLPSLMMDGLTLVISPLISLMKNQVDLLKAANKNDRIAHVLNSTLNKQQVKEVYDDLKSGITKLLYISPESLVKKEYLDLFRTLKINFVAVDEAHCISEWGHDFRPEYKNIKTQLNLIRPNISIMALTATATKKVQTDIIKNLEIKDAKIFNQSFNRANLFYEVKHKNKNVNKEIIHFLKKNKGKSGIVYCANRKTVEELAKLIQLNDVSCLPYHAGIDSKIRVKNQDDFLNQKVDVIVATIAFGMGIDKPDIRFVIHYDIPKSLEGFYQETGRAGRDGIDSYCILYYCMKDVEKVERIYQSKLPTDQEISNQLLNEVVGFSVTGDCRRKYLLRYFGENYNKPHCKEQGNCDNCKNPKKIEDATKELIFLLESIKMLKEMHKQKYLIEFIMGIETVSIKNFKHDKLPNFGIGKHKSQIYWVSLLKKAILEEFIYKEIETFGIIKLNEKAFNYLINPFNIYMSLDNEFQDEEYDEFEDNNEKNQSTVDETLFKILDTHRKNVALKENLPPFVIFSEPSLNDMCIQYPTTLIELKKIYGISEGKAEKFGSSFVEIIKNYVLENDIKKEEEIVVKTIANKSAIKVHIIQGIDRNLNLNDIAKSKNLTEDQLIKEIETIFFSGTHLNLKYFIENNIDKEVIENVEDYFMDAHSDSIELAIQKLGNDYTESEIRLVRLNFLATYGS